MVSMFSTVVHMVSLVIWWWWVWVFFNIQEVVVVVSMFNPGWGVVGSIGGVYLRFGN